MVETAPAAVPAAALAAVTAAVSESDAFAATASETASAAGSDQFVYFDASDHLAERAFLRIVRRWPHRTAGSARPRVTCNARATSLLRAGCRGARGVGSAPQS